MDDKESMFVEFEEVFRKFQSGDNEVAMIILERTSDGVNKHGMCGDTKSLVTLFEWGLNTISEGYDIPFNTLIKLIEYKHHGTEHIKYKDLKEEIRQKLREDDIYDS